MWPIMEVVIFIRQDTEFKNVRWQDMFWAICNELITARYQ
jgi:hypothetical protein